MTTDHRRAEEAYPILVDVAKKCQKITYEELCKKINPNAPPHPRFDAGRFLGIIEATCLHYELPVLTALVVLKTGRDAGFPGEGYEATPRRGKKYEQELKKVHSYQWPKVPPFPLVRHKNPAPKNPLDPAKITDDTKTAPNRKPIRKFNIDLFYDEEVGVYGATSKGIPGLFLEAKTIGGIMDALVEYAPELIENNLKIPLGDERFRFVVGSAEVVPAKGGGKLKMTAGKTLRPHMEVSFPRVEDFIPTTIA